MSPALRRATALVLSWVFTATSVWSAAHPIIRATPGAAGPVTLLHAAGPVPSLPGGRTATSPFSALPPDPAPVALNMTGWGHSSKKAVKPILECVTEEAPGQFRAYFGYKNENSGNVSIGTGDKNRFSPSPKDRGQPESFSPGRTPYFPDAAFSVPFDGDELVWKLKGPDGKQRTATASSGSERCPATPPPPSCDTTFFGGKRYTRTCGKPNVYTDTVTVPDWVTAPFVLKVVNGSADGRNRVSSATIEIDGDEVARPSDFNQNVAGFDRVVTLQPRSAIKVKLSSKPGSYLTLSLCGKGADKTAPAVFWSLPVPGSATNDPTPRLVVRYPDEPGPGEPAGSGADVETLQVLLDDVDRTGLFSALSEEASVDLPEALALADGPHRLKARIRDRAGNQGEAEAEFRVDRAPPGIEVVEPARDAFLPSDSAAVRVRYEDESALDLASLRILVNGEDATALFDKGPAEATATVAGLNEGGNQVTASIRDAAGNGAADAVAFNVDTLPPTITIAQPAVDARLGSSDVEVIVRYADAQALVLESFAATVDGGPVVLGQGSEGAMGRVSLADGPHVVAARISDRAGHEATASAAFRVDTAAPVLEVVQPPAGFPVTTPTPRIVIGYEDADGVDPATLRVRINGDDRTDWFSRGPDTAEGTVQEELPQGENRIEAEVEDLTGNRAVTNSVFTVDSLAPTGEVVLPPARTNLAPPPVRVTYADGGTGVDPASVRLFVDGTERMGILGAGDGEAAGVLLFDPPLADGSHELRITLADRAGNPGEVLGSFLLDTTLPAVQVVAPAPGAFTNDPTPTVRIAYSDTGSGVDPASVRVFLRHGQDEELELTGLDVGADEAIGEVPEPLDDGAYTIRAVLQDLAGNPAATPEIGFDVDTVAPTYDLVTPAPGAFVTTTTPFFTIDYRDLHSGVDVSRFALLVDGQDRSGRLGHEQGRATGALMPADALAQGEHQVVVRVFDRAGNAGPETPLVFSVDSVPPTAALDLPVAGSYVGTALPAVRATYSDPEGGSGIDVESVRIELDGVDRTASFPPGAASAEGTPPVPLPDGLHTLKLEVADQAGNATVVTSTFHTDTQPPALDDLSLEDGSFVAELQPDGTIRITGRFEDLDPSVTVQCRTGTTSVTATIAGGQFTCDVPLAEGENGVEVVATDGNGHETTVTRTVTLDTRAPQLAIHSPGPDHYTKAHLLTVTGEVIDDNPVKVVVEGVVASVSGQAFTATAVPVGDPPLVTLHAVATDAAGNQGTAEVTVHVDREAPEVHITSPAMGSWVKGPTLLVEGTFADDSPVMVYVNGLPADLDGDRFSMTIPALPGPFQVEAVAQDAAANAGTDVVAVNVDSGAPVITVTDPEPGLVTRADAVLVAGTVEDESPVSLRIGETLVPVAPDGAFAHEASLAPGDGTRSIPLVATDLAGNQGTAAVELTVDRTPPVLDVIAPDDGAALGGLPVVVQGFVHDLTETTVTVDGVLAERTGDAWLARIDGLDDGPHTFQVLAVDAAGNTSQASRSAVLDLSSPVLTIDVPGPMSLLREETVDVTGSVSAASGITSVLVNGRPATLGPGAYAAAGVPLDEGDNTIEAVATSGVGRVATAQVMVTRDSVPPGVELAVPDRITLGQTVRAVVTAADAGVGVEEVLIRVQGVVVATFTTPPYEADIGVPAGLGGGDSFTVVAEAADRAGNRATSEPRQVTVASDSGVVVGQVLSDHDGLPLAEARVRLLSPEGDEIATGLSDERGRYSFRTTDPEARVVADRDGMTAVERDLAVEPGVGTVAVDARLTTLAAVETVGPEGGALEKGAIKATIPAGALAGPTELRLTPLSPQGLPALLPLGWSPAAAFDLRAEGLAALTADLSVSGFADLPPGTTLHLARFRPSPPGWVTAAADLVPDGDGAVESPLAEPGSYAVVVPDATDPPILPPAPGGLLEGRDMVTIPEDATSTGLVEPAVMPPSGGTARGSLAVHTATALPSGTLVQAEVRETFTLASGDVASEETRTQDIVLYRFPAPEGAALAARLPITPSRSFAVDELVQGTVDLDILAGRESVRGQTGGNRPLQLESGDATLILPAGALAQDTAIVFDRTVLSSFLPSLPGFVPLAEMVADFSGQTLALAAEVRVASPGGIEGTDTLLVVRVERLDGIPRLAVVGLAETGADGRLVSKPRAGFPGVVRGGRYVFYRVLGPVGFVKGFTLAEGSAVRAVVEAAGLPVFVFSDPAAGYLLPALPGSAVALEARVLNTALQGEDAAAVVAGAETAKDILLEGQVTSASVTPAPGSLAVEPSTQVVLEASAPMNPGTVNAANVRLFKGPPADAVTVPVQLRLSATGRLLTLTPEAGLEFSTDYTLRVSDVADVFGGLVTAAEGSFRTRDDAPPVYDVGKLTFSLPDAEGIVTIEAPDGTFPPGTTILIVNAGNGHVVSLTAGNLGEVGPERMAATIDDRMVVTITDPRGNVTSFERTKFVAPDGTTAIGTGGGTVEHPSGLELRIPEGALDKAVTLKIEPFTPAPTDPLPKIAVDEQGNPLAHFGVGLKIESDKPIPNFKREVKLAFPLPDGLPDAPADAFFYVVRRIDGPNGPAFETIDQAFLEGAPGEQKVITASYPFSGFETGLGLMAFSPLQGFAIGAVTTSLAYLMWSYDQALPGKPLPGVITGKVLRATFGQQAGEPTYEPVVGALVTGVDPQGIPLVAAGDDPNVAITQDDGTFTLWDFRYQGGTVRIVAVLPGGNPTKACPEVPEPNIRCATAYEANPQDWKSTGLRFYRNIATANVTFPPQEPAPPPAEVDIRVIRVVEEPGPPPRESRYSTDGIVSANTKLLIGVLSDIEVTGATINGVEQTVIADPAIGREPPETLLLDQVIDPLYVPAQPGTYTVEFTALPAFGDVLRVRSTFRVVAETGGTRTVLDDPPKVIEARTIPKDGSQGNPVTVFPQVAFTEPVRDVPGNVELLEVTADGEEPVDVVLVGVGFDEVGQPRFYADLGLEPQAAITALTFQPRRGLKYGARYRMVLGEGIVDLDVDAAGDPAPKSLEPFTSSFSTLTPGNLTPPGQGDTWVSPGVAVLADRGRAYLVQNNFFNGTVRAFNVEDPQAPSEIESARAFVTWRPVDLAVQAETKLPGTAESFDLLVVATTLTNRSVPSNIYVFDVTDDAETRWVGAASLASSAIDGYINRIALKGRYVYSASGRKGIQVVDLDAARRNFETQDGGSAQMRLRLNGDGQGFGQSAVVQTIPLYKPLPEGAPPGTPPDRYWLADVDAADFFHDGRPQVLVGVTGHLPLAMANPQAGEVLYQGPVAMPVPAPADPDEPPPTSLTLGSAIALARLPTLDPTGTPVPRPYAIVVGTGTVDGAAAAVLAVVDVTDPAAPQTLRIIRLAGYPQDVIVRDELAIVGEDGQAELVSLAVPADPLVVGAIPDVGARLALGKDGYLFSTARGIIGGPTVTDPLGGLRIASLDTTPPLLALKTPRVALGQLLKDGTRAESEVPVEFTLTREALVTLTVEGRDVVEGKIDDRPAALVLDQVVGPGLHRILVPSDLLDADFLDWRPFTLRAQAVADSSIVESRTGRFANDVINRRVSNVGHTFVKGVSLSDGHLVYRATDVRLPGRNLQLDFTRTYSSHALGEDDTMGAGWTWTYGGLTVTLYKGVEGPDHYVVKTADGTSQLFRTVDDGVNMIPDKGYHSRLEKTVSTRADGTEDITLDLYDLAGNRYHFKDVREEEFWTTPPVAWKLEYLREPHGDEVQLEYDSRERVKEVIDAPGGTPRRRFGVEYREYGPAGEKRSRVSRVFDKNGLGLVVEYEHDDLGNLRKATRTGENLPGQPPARAAAWEYTYVADTRDPHQLASVRDPDFNRTTYDYGSADQAFMNDRGVIGVTEDPKRGQPLVVTRFDYVIAGPEFGSSQTTVTDPRRNATVYVVADDGTLDRIDEPLGKTTDLDWDAEEVRKTREVDSLAKVTTYAYDDNGNVRVQTVSRGGLTAETQTDHHPVFNVPTRMRDPEGRTTTWDVDGLGDVRGMTDGALNQTSYGYDGAGQLTSVTDPRGNQAGHGAFDSFGQPRSTSLPEGIQVSRQYDARGRLTSETDSVGRRTEYTYDGLDRLVEARRFSGAEGSADEVTVTEYTTGGQVFAVTNAAGARTTYDRDGLNRVLGTVTVWQGRTLATTARRYDQNGNVVEETDARGVKRKLTYDELNRLTLVEILSGPSPGPAGPVARFDYDPEGNLLAETNLLSGVRTEYEHDGLYRVKKKTIVDPRDGTRFVEECAHDLVGNRTSVKDFNGSETVYRYEGLDRVDRITRPLGHVVEIAYEDPGGSHVNKTRETYQPQGLRIEYAYDGLNRETSRTVHLDGPGGAGDGPYETTTDYDDAAHTVTVTDPRQNATELTLDGLDRVLTQVVGVGSLGLETKSTYDGLGRPVVVTNPRGFDTVYEHDGLGRLLSVTDAKQKQATYSYFGDGLRQSEKDRRDTVRNYAYDNLGRPTSVVLVPNISFKGWSRTITWDDAGRKRVERDARDLPTTYELDALDREVKVTDAREKSVERTFVGLELRAEKDRRGHSTTFGYDALHRVTLVTDPAPFGGQTYVTAYQDAQNRRLGTDRRGTPQLTQLDPLGRVRSITRAGVLLETSAYDGNDNRTSSVDGEGHRTEFAYDAADRLEAIVEGAGSSVASRTTLERDANGNVEEERQERVSQAIIRTFDDLDRMETLRNREGETTTFEYDAEGYRRRMRDPKQRTTEYLYGELGELLRVTQPSVPAGTPVFTYEYDENRNQVKRTDGEDQVVLMGHDDLNRLESMTQDPGGLDLVTTYEYDENGNQVERKDPKGQVVTATYDSLNRVEQQTFAALPAELPGLWMHTKRLEYDYDGNDNVERIRDLASGLDPPDLELVTRRGYDLLDRLTSEETTFPEGGTRTVDYDYFRNGTRKSVAERGGATTLYGYDAKNRLETAATPAGTTRYDYHPDDLLRGVSHPNGVIAAYAYDRAGRLLSVQNSQGGSLVSRFSYGYDDNGNRETQVEAHGEDPPEPTAYEYDALDRLEEVTYPPEPGFPEGRRVTYGYDRVGNRASEDVLDLATGATVGRSMSYDRANRLRWAEEAGGPTVTYGHDDNGNLVSQAAGGVTTRYVFDPQDQLVEVAEDREVALPGGGTGLETRIPARFQYDFAGRRTKKIGLEGTRQYVYDGTSLFLEFAGGGNPPAVARHDWGLGLVSSYRFGTDERRFVSSDALGSITDLTDPDGLPTARYRLDAWGDFRFPSDLDASPNRFAFTGYFFDKETSLYNAKARYFDPRLGRFRQQDSFLGVGELPDTLHRYAYVSNRPTYATDPDGNLAPLLFVPLLVGLIATEATIIHQEVTEGKELWTFDPRKGVDTKRAFKTGGLVAGSTLIAMATAGLATPALAGAGYGATSSAVIGGAFGNALGGFAAGTAGGLLEGQSLGASLEMGGYAGLAGAVGGVLAQGVGAGTARLLGGSRAAAGLGHFAGGFGGDVLAQGVMGGEINYWQAGFGGLMSVGSGFASQGGLGLAQSRLGRSITRTLASELYMAPRGATMMADAFPPLGTAAEALSRIRLRAPTGQTTVTLRYVEGMSRREFLRKAHDLQRLGEEGALVRAPNPVPRDPAVTAKFRRALIRKINAQYGLRNPVFAERLIHRVRHEMQPDHIWELQLGGPDIAANLRMLHGFTNWHVGTRQIRSQLVGVPVGTRVRIRIEGID